MKVIGPERQQKKCDDFFSRLKFLFSLFATQSVFEGVGNLRSVELRFVWMHLSYHRYFQQPFLIYCPLWFCDNQGPSTTQFTGSLLYGSFIFRAFLRNANSSLDDWNFVH